MENNIDEIYLVDKKKLEMISTELLQNSVHLTYTDIVKLSMSDIRNVYKGINECNNLSPSSTKKYYFRYHCMSIGEFAVSQVIKQKVVNNG